MAVKKTAMGYEISGSTRDVLTDLNIVNRQLAFRCQREVDLGTNKIDAGMIDLCKKRRALLTILAQREIDYP